MWSDLDPAVRRRAQAIRLALFDCDGVLTDGRLWFGPDGESLKVFDVRDGHGLVLLQRHGIAAGLVSGRDSPAVSARMRGLGIALVYQGCEDKPAALADALARTGCSAQETAFVGDDLPDLPVLAQVGLAVAVADAHPAVCARAHWRTRAPGGRGAVREFCELLLAARGVDPAAGP